MESQLELLAPAKHTHTHTHTRARAVTHTCTHIHDIYIECRLIIFIVYDNLILTCLKFGPTCSRLFFLKFSLKSRHCLESLLAVPLILLMFRMVFDQVSRVPLSSFPMFLL